MWHSVAVTGFPVSKGHKTWRSVQQKWLPFSTFTQQSHVRMPPFCQASRCTGWPCSSGPATTHNTAWWGQPVLGHRPLSAGPCSAPSPLAPLPAQGSQPCCLEVAATRRPSGNCQAHFESRSKSCNSWQGLGCLYSPFPGGMLLNYAQAGEETSPVFLPTPHFLLACPDVTSNLNTYKSFQEREESFPNSSPKPKIFLKGCDCGEGGGGKSQNNSLPLSSLFLLCPKKAQLLNKQRCCPANQTPCTAAPALSVNTGLLLTTTFKLFSFLKVCTWTKGTLRPYNNKPIKLETYPSVLRTHPHLIPLRPLQQKPSKEENIQRFLPCNAVLAHLDSLLKQPKRTEHSGDLTANQSRRIAPQGKRQTSFSPQSGFWQNSAGRL